MKNILFVILFLFLFQFSFSQTEKLIQGRVLSADFPVEGIEIVNLVTEKKTTTDSNGRFRLLVKADDMLVFISEKYDYKRLFLDKEFLDKNNFIILLTRKPEQLKEVVITKISFPKIKFDKNIASQLNIEKAANNPKPFGVHYGTIENGIGMIINIPSSRKKIPEIEFKELTKTNYPETFFTDTLKLKPEEVALFLEFCDADPKSKIVLENVNSLSIMNFLLTKNIEFKKLPAFEK
jgi:KaiC/GvpD/RAD55 family RecA-like ATPase